jgi:Protein of unknown function (DUF1579)
MAKNSMAHFEVFIGTWNTTGNVFAVGNAPATTLAATDTYRWLPGKKFIVHEVDARFGQDVSRSIEIMGFDLQAKRYRSRSYDDQGASEQFEIELTPKRWKIMGNSVRFDGQFDASANKLSGLWETKTSNRTWKPWIELELVRA